MRTENVSNDTLKSTPMKSSFQNIGLGNQLFNIGSGDQSFDRILSDQAGSKALTGSNPARENASAASKKANPQGQSGKNLPADNHHQQVAAQQEKLALRHKRQESAEEQARADAAAEQKNAATDQQAEQATATEQRSDFPIGKAESAAENSAEGEVGTNGDTVLADGETGNEEVEAVEIIDAEATAQVEAAVDAEVVELDETLEATVESELDSNQVTAVETADDLKASVSKLEDDSVKPDAAALIDEVLATVPAPEQSVELDPSADTSSAQGDSENSISSASAAVAAMALQTDATRQATAELSNESADSSATTVSADKSSQTVPNVNLNQFKGAEQSEKSATAVAEALDAEANVLNSAGEKLTDAQDPLKLDVAKANKNAGNNEQIATPVQERLAALAKSLEKPSKDGQSSLQRKTTESIETVKGNSFQRNVDQISRLQANAAKPLTTIATPMNQKEWAGEMGQRLLMMVSSKVQSAQIQVTPGDMGPIDVKVSMQKDQAHVVFTSHVPQTRDALEQALPKLREMLDQNGVAMGNVDVRDQGAHQSSQRQGQEQQQRSARGHENGLAATESTTETVSIQQLGVVDFYA